jgi:hypothetical protein
VLFISEKFWELTSTWTILIDQVTYKEQTYPEEYLTLGWGIVFRTCTVRSKWKHNSGLFERHPISQSSQTIYNTLCFNHLQFLSYTCFIVTSFDMHWYHLQACHTLISRQASNYTLSPSG